MLDLAAELKAAKREDREEQKLKGREIALIFEKDSTRTRCAFEVASLDQGAHVTFIGPSGSHMGHKETVKDTARVLSRMFDAIEYRAFGQSTAVDLAKWSGVPVYNGGNALLRRGEPMTAENQRANVARACAALAPLAREHQLVISHGNGPQVGLLALQGAAYTEVETDPLDVLDAQSEGMIGYLIMQELGNLLPLEKPLTTILTMIEVDSGDPAFENPTKPIAPIYTAGEAAGLAEEKGWAFSPMSRPLRRLGNPAPTRDHAGDAGRAGCDTVRRGIDGSKGRPCGVPSRRTDRRDRLDRIDRRRAGTARRHRRHPRGTAERRRCYERRGRSDGDRLTASS